MAIVSSSSLAPGFRFHPTDEELVFYYLRRKICGKSFRVDAISQIDIYKLEPWDLPGKSKLKSRDKEWYFFSMLDKKYGSSQRTNRATEKGYWKTTGKDRAVYHRSKLVGMKKTLVYHCGRAPRGERSNWVMHEYRLIDEALAKAGFNQDSFVLCRVFQKSGTGPKNGEHYGASLIEEEWENEELELPRKPENGVDAHLDEFYLQPKIENEEEVDTDADAHLDEFYLQPKIDNEEEVDADADAYLDEFYLKPKMEDEEEADPDADAYLDGLDLQQILSTDIAPIDAARPSDLYHYDENSAEDSTGSTDNTLSQMIGELLDDHELFEMPHQYGMKARLVKHEYLGESSRAPEELGFSLDDEPFWDSAANHQFYDGSFLETKDLFNPIAADTFDFDDETADFLVFNDPNDANEEELNHVNVENLAAVEEVTYPSCETSVSVEDMNIETQRAIKSSDQLIQHDGGASSSAQKELDEFASGIGHYPFLEKASQMLSSIPAPHAFAAEFPSKGAMKHLGLSRSSNQEHVTAGIIHIRSLSISTSRTSGLLGKDEGYNIIFSLGLSPSNFNTAYMESSVSLLSPKFAAALSGGWFYAILHWLLLLPLSFKLGTLVWTR